MINTELIEKYANQFVDIIAKRVDNIALITNSKELAAVKFLSEAKMTKHFGVDLKGLNDGVVADVDNNEYQFSDTSIEDSDASKTGNLAGITTDEILRGSDNLIFKLNRWSKLPSEGHVWSSGRKALVYDHVGAGKGIELPNDLEVFC